MRVGVHGLLVTCIIHEQLNASVAYSTNVRPKFRDYAEICDSTREEHRVYRFAVFDVVPLSSLTGVHQTDASRPPVTLAIRTGYHFLQTEFSAVSRGKSMKRTQSSQEQCCYFQCNPRYEKLDIGARSSLSVFS